MEVKSLMMFLPYSLQEESFLTFLYNDEVHSYDEVWLVSFPGSLLKPGNETKVWQGLLTGTW